MYIELNMKILSTVIDNAILIDYNGYKESEASFEIDIYLDFEILLLYDKFEKKNNTKGQNTVTVCHIFVSF